MTHLSPLDCRQIVLLALSLGMLAVSRLAFAQDPVPNQPLSLVEQAYEKTKTAQTAAAFTEIVELLDKALAGNLPAGKVQYANRLRGWGLNRRGEVQSTAADAARAEGEEEQAKRLDKVANVDFEEALKADPTHWKALHNRGVSFAQAGKYEQALGDFDRALELNPRYPNTWFNRGEIYYTQGEFERAIDDYNQVLALAPNDAGATISRGHAEFQLGRYSEALSDYSLAVNLNPRDATARTNRGDAYQGLGQWERAAADYRQAIALDPKLARAHQCAAWLLASCPDERFRNPALALEASQKAIELGGENHQTLDAFAAAQASASRFDEAQVTIAKAIAAAPEDAKGPLKQRLELYKSKRPYRQSAVTIRPY